MAELNELRSETRRLEGAPGRRPRTFGIIIVLILITGLGAAGGGAAGLLAVAGRHPTQAQISVAGQREFAVLWQRLPAGQIFLAVTTTAQAAPGMVSVGAHFGGGPPGVISALPPGGPVVDVYWALMGMGVLLLVAAVLLAVQRPRRARRAARAARARHRHGPRPAPGPPPPGPQYPGPTYPDSPYPGPPPGGPQNPGPQLPG